MKVQCPKCNTTYRIPDDRIPAGGGTVKVRCKNCGNVMDVQAAGGGGAPVSETRWFVAVGNDKRGPMSREQVLALIRSGEIGSETYVWRKGFQEWQRLGDVAELAAEESRPRAVETDSAPAGISPGEGKRDASSDMEPTVMEPLPTGAAARDAEPAASSAPAASGAGSGSTVFPAAPSEATGGAPGQEEDSQTQMIWQRRETSVLFSLDDYKTRKKTRSTKGMTAPAPVVQVQPIGPAKPEAPAPRGTERIKVISLEEAEVKRVAEALSRRQRRRALVRNALLGFGGAVVVAAVAYVVATRSGGEEPAPPQEQATRPSPVVPAPVVPPPQAKEPVAAPTAPPAVEAAAPKPESPPSEPAKETAKRNGHPPAARATQRPGRVEASTPAPSQRVQPEAPPSPPARPATDDVNALLANLRSGQGEGGATPRDQTEKPGAESGEVLPEQLTTGQIQSVLRKQQKPVEECIRKSGVAPGTTVMVNTRVEIEGSGRVSSASVSNAGAAEACIRSVLTGLRFPRFKGPNMAVPYPFRVSL